jgi:hypothetical protein
MLSKSILKKSSKILLKSFVRSFGAMDQVN